MQSTAKGPAAILSIYISGACNKQPAGAQAATAIAFGNPFATREVPSTGSTAISTFATPSCPFPTTSPIYNIGASSISPSPITTVPSIGSSLNIDLIASTAAPSAPFLSPFPKKYEERIAAASVTLTKFKVKFLSIVSSYYLTLSQSFKNFSIPISVNGCFNICLNTL